MKTTPNTKRLLGGGGDTPFIKPNVSHCVQENEVHYNKILNFNNHAYVDLGLPSGTLWATMNIGAEDENDMGYEFMWGDIEPCSSGNTSSWENYKYVDQNFDFSDYVGCYDNENMTHIGYAPMTKYNAEDGKMILEPNDDAAHMIWGGDWTMPTVQQLGELFDNTNRDITSNMATFTSKINNNVLLLPMDYFGAIWSKELYHPSNKSNLDYQYAYSLAVEDVYPGTSYRGGIEPIDSMSLNCWSARYVPKNIRPVVTP